MTGFVPRLLPTYRSDFTAPACSLLMIYSNKHMALLYFNQLRLLIVLSALSGLMLACTENFMAGSSPADAAPEKGLMSIRYEAENLTYQELGDAAKATAIDKIHAMAKAVRSKISLEIYEDGTSAWRLEKMTPKHDVYINDQTPSNPMPQTKVTQLSRTGRAYFYGPNGALLKEHDVKTQSFSSLISHIRQDPSVAYSIIGVKSKQQVAQLIANAKRSGATILPLGNGNISIRSSGATVTARGARGAADNYTSVDIVNPELGVLVGSSLYDDKNQLVNQVFYKYKLGENKALIPEAMHQKSWSKNTKTGETYATISDTSFDNVSATINNK